MATWRVSGLLLLLPSMAGGQVFGPATVHDAGQEPVAIQVADVDRRLGLDLVVANRNGGSIVAFLAEGDGTFGDGVVLSAVAFPEELLALDADRDGDVDLAVTTQGGSGSPELVIMRNRGDGTFSVSTQNTLRFVRRLAAADLDRDGDVDLAGVNENEDSVTIFLGGSLGTFSESASYAVGDNPVALVAVDLDLANGPDLAVAHVGGTDGVSVLLNGGGASFPTFTDYPVTLGGNPLALAALDLDGALGPDLVAGNSLTGDLSVLLATGSGLFAAAVSFAVPGAGFPSSLGTGDLDDDGDVDVLVGQRTGRSVAALLSDGAGGLSPDPASPYPVPLDTVALHVEDVDFDNAPDALVATADTADPSLTGFAVVLPNALGPFGPVVATTSLPDGAMDQAYAATLVATGGTPPYVWDVAAGSLPAGITLNPGTGTLSGTPGVAGVGTSYVTVRARDAAFLTGTRALSLTVRSPASILAAKGGGGASAYDQRLAGYEADGTPIAAMAFNAFALTGYGARLSRGELDGDGFDEILATPGPGPNHPPAVRGYDRTGVPVPFVDFFAYGVLRYGASSSGGDVDGTLHDEILAGPGPGPTFGPQVRAFTYDGTTFPQPKPSVNFYAYGTLRFGVSVAVAAADADPESEILTGAGPGAVFGPHVRGFDLSGSTLGPLPGLSFFAYGTPRYGVNVAGGALDGAGATDALVTGPGPGAVFAAHLRGFRYASSVSAIGNLSAVVYGSRFGLHVDAADVDGDGYDEIVASPGPDAVAGSRVRVYGYDGAALSGPSFDEDPFGLAFGARATGAALGY